jgi:hypothetical protein
VEYSRSASVRAACVLLTAAVSLAMAQFYQQTWMLRRPADVVSPDGSYLGYHVQLTSISGSHAVAAQEYYNDDDECYRTWVTVVGRRLRSTGNLVSAEYAQLFAEPDTVTVKSEADAWSRPPCVALGASRKHVAWGRYSAPSDKVYREARTALTSVIDDWPWSNLNDEGHAVWQDQVTVGTQRSENVDYAYAAYIDSFTQNGDPWLKLVCARSANDGTSWTNVQVDAWPYYSGIEEECGNPSIAVEQGGTEVYLVYESGNYVFFHKSTDNGQSWSEAVDLSEQNGGERPCIAALGDTVFAAWEDDQIGYRWTTNGGETWIPDLEDDPYEMLESVEWWPNRLNLSMVRTSVAGTTRENVVLVCNADLYDEQTHEWTCGAAFMWAKNISGNWLWSAPIWLASRGNLVDQDTLLSPSVTACASPRTSGGPDYDTAAFLVWSYPPGGEDPFRHVYRRVGRWQYDCSRVMPPAKPVNTGRNLAGGLDGCIYHSGVLSGYAVAGPVVGHTCLPVIVDAGEQSALALDGDGQRWVSYVRDDTLWTMNGDGSYEAVFCGSSSAVPGQPSIACYPTQTNDMYYGAVVFPVSDTAGGTGQIMFARVCSSEVVLDTIESVANLGDSLPCISIYKTDSLICTWSHSGAVYSSLLADYGPGTVSRPGPWSSPNVVTSDGYHPMSIMENGVLECVWCDEDNGKYAVRRATNDLSMGGMFQSWTAQTDPSGDSAVEKANPVACGVGVSCWQQIEDGNWVIKAKVRNAETTLVRCDSGAYHPHAVADSSNVSPSISRVSVKLLWTEGVIFEVDSGVCDTGVTVYTERCFDVSNAGANSTGPNTGVKLLRKPGSDSLHCLYAGADGTVWYARSAAGDSWKRDQLVPDRDWPAIAEDSSGRRWATLHGTDGATSAGLIEAYYLYNSGWVLLQTVYTADPEKTIGPAALAGASLTTLPIAYAAFKVEGENGTYTIKVAKFDGTNLDTVTIASGSNLGDPSIAIQSVSQDSDFIHVVWSDDGEVKYRMDRDGRGNTIASNWTSVINLSSTEAASVHPFIGADRDQIVVAWAEGSTAEIYSRKRATTTAYNNWESSANLSNTASKVSDWPTIALGDTVVVCWSEYRTGDDYDIMACIDFGDTISIADNGTKSGYPHVLFQNKTSGDTAIPYLHTVWSDGADVYEVGYNKLNLKQLPGEGQQSASSTPIPRKPSLEACKPNPFRDRTLISYQLPQAGNVSLRVYDVTGRTVRTLASGHKQPGAYTVTWDSKDSRGRQVPHGIYFYRLDTPGFREVKKAVVAR